MGISMLMAVLLAVGGRAVARFGKETLRECAVGAGAELERALVRGIWEVFDPLSGEDWNEDPSYRQILKEERDRTGRTDPVRQAAASEPEPETAEAKVTRTEPPQSAPGKLYAIEKLADYDYLVQNFYNIHTSTTADRELLDARAFAETDLSIRKKEGEPQILIYHTHSQEAYRGSAPGETVVQVGAALAERLREKGYGVIHDQTSYDLSRGKLDRSKAYSYALEGIHRILDANPSIEVVLDVHRDGVGESVRLVTEIDGKPTARLMFFNGISRTPDGRNVDYLPNPWLQENLAFSFQLQRNAAAWYPGLTRKIYLKGLRYNLHLRARSSLIEVGAQTNTFEEAMNSVGPLAELLDMVLQEK